MRFPVEVVRRSRDAGRRRLPDHVPDLAARPGRGRPDLGRGASSSRTRSRRPASPSSTPASAGTRRGCRRSSPRSRAAPGARRPRGSRPRCRSRSARPTGSTPRSWPRRSSPPARPTWSRWPGRCSPTPTSSPRPRAGRADEINTCIACNQACLDHAFENKRASCLVNPRACRETTLVLAPTRTPSAPSPSSAPARPGSPPRCPRPSAGSRSPLFERGLGVGGQFRLAMRVPGKEEFAETLRYYTRRLEVLGVDVRLGDRGHGGRPGAVRRGRRRDRRRPRGCPTLAGIDHPRSCRTPTCSPARSCRAGGSRWSARRHRRRRQPLPDPRPGGHRATTGWRTGASATRPCTRAG